jgi:protein-S-isoprenylcysteine O-methyltransferase Ste14
MLALGGYMLWPGVLAWAAFSLPAWARGLGLALGLLSVALMVWVQRALGANFDVTLHLRAEHTLVMDGPYRWVRHPMYSVLFLFELAVLLLSANWFVGGVPLVALALIVATRVRREEQVMLTTFGETYRRYMQRTGRFLPRRSLR